MHAGPQGVWRSVSLRKAKVVLHFWSLVQLLLAIGTCAVYAVYLLTELVFLSDQVPIVGR